MIDKVVLNHGKGLLCLNKFKITFLQGATRGCNT